MFIEILFKILLFKGGVLIYTEHCVYIYIYKERERERVYILIKYRFFISHVKFAS